MFRFDKDITFRQLYDVLKRYKEYISIKKILQWSCCLRSACMLFFLVNGLNKKLYPESRLPATINELVAGFSREDIEKCIFGNFEKCSYKTVSHEDFNVDLIGDLDSENSNTRGSHCDDNDQTAIVVFYE